MKIYSIETGNFMLDGGTMFGVVPKAIWEKLYPCNEKNLVNLSMRSMLVCDENKNILIDTGLGENLDEKFKSIYFPNGSHTIDDSLINKGVTKDDITDVIVTHLHFDHCGGNVIKENGHFVPAFPNATYHISLDQWKSALSPNKKEKASFCHNHFLPLKESGQLQLIEKNTNISSNVNIRLFNGHTKGLIVPFINYKKRTIVYCSDLIPVMAHIPLPYICAYDIAPLVSIEEKENFLSEAYDNKYILFFEHDIMNECCTLKKSEKGIRPDKTFALSTLDKA